MAYNLLLGNVKAEGTVEFQREKHAAAKTIYKRIKDAYDAYKKTL